VKPLLQTIIFSKNRAFQLHALLSSMRLKVKTLKPFIHTAILWSADGAHKDQYSELIQMYPEFEWIEETSFRDQVIQKLDGSKAKRCMFLVDDIIFTREIDLVDAVQLWDVNEGGAYRVAVSLRLGIHLTRCYALDCEQAHPNTGRIVGPWFVWNWKDAHSKGDWSYPFSLDGHIFSTGKLRSWIDHLDFGNPNEMESEMASKIPTTFNVSQSMLCYVHAPLFNMPLNRVQDQFKNRCEEISVQELFEHFHNGDELDLDRYDNILNTGCHFPMPVYLRKRKID